MHTTYVVIIYGDIKIYGYSSKVISCHSPSCIPDSLLRDPLLSSTGSSAAITLVLFRKLVTGSLARLNLSLSDDLLDDIVLILRAKLIIRQPSYPLHTIRKTICVPHSRVVAWRVDRGFLVLLVQYTLEKHPPPASMGSNCPFSILPPPVRIPQ